MPVFISYQIMKIHPDPTSFRRPRKDPETLTITVPNLCSIHDRCRRCQGLLVLKEAACSRFGSPTPLISVFSKPDGHWYVGRRYFRFFKFLECFSKALECFYAASGVMGLLEVGKWSFLGVYLFLESLTIVSVFRFVLLSVLIEK